MPKTSVTPWATIVSTSASDGVIFTFPFTTSRLPWVMSFICGSSRETNGKFSTGGTVYDAGKGLARITSAHGRRKEGPDPPRPERACISTARGCATSTARPASCATAATRSTTWRSTPPSRRPATCCSTASCRPAPSSMPSPPGSRSARSLPPAVLQVIEHVKSAHPMDVLRTAVSALAAFDPDVADNSPAAHAAQGRPAHRAGADDRRRARAHPQRPRARGARPGASATRRTSSTC